MGSPNNHRSEDYLKKIWKILSKGPTMDNMRRELEMDEEYARFQENIEKDLKTIIEGSEPKTYEEIFIALGELNAVPDVSEEELESLIEKAVDVRKNSLPQETKEKIFKKWDALINKEHKQKN